MKLTELAALFVVVVCLLFAGYGKGRHDANMAHTQEQADKAKHALRMVEAEAARSATASAAWAAEQAELQTNYQTLQEKYDELRRHGLPLVAARSAADAHTSGAPGCAPGAACIASPGTHRSPGQAGDPAACVLVALADADVELSLGAVRLWNGALSGADAPAGACGADGAPPEACATGAGIGLEAAWANHAANAQSCAQDRQRLRRLIDYIQHAQDQP